jgi:hypothetical protein
MPPDNGTPVPLTRSFVPVPDPTSLTTDQLRREITALRELTEARFEELEADSKSIIQSVVQLGELHKEKFKGVKTQFKERDTRQKTKGNDDKTAIDAALKSIQESMTKTENAFDRRISDLTSLVDTKTASIARLYDDLKERVVAMESTRKGGGEMWGYILGGLGLLALVADVIIHVK